MGVSLAELARPSELTGSQTPEVLQPPKVIIFDCEQLLEVLESFPHPRVDPDFQRQLEKLRVVTERAFVPESLVATVRVVGLARVDDGFLQVSHDYFTMGTSYRRLGNPRIIQVQGDTVQGIGFDYEEMVYRLYQIEEDQVILVVNRPPADSFIQDPTGGQRYVLNPLRCHIPPVL